MRTQPRSLRRPLVVGLALAASSAGVIGATDAQARKARPVELTETTVITATHSGWVDVTVPDDAMISTKVQNNPDTSIDGAGRFVALSMQSFDAGDFYSSADSVETYRLPTWLGGKQITYGSSDDKYTCSSGTPVGPTTVPVGGGQCDYTPGKHVILHEGFYRISVLADGAPVQITLTLHGLDEGTTTVPVTHDLNSLEKTLPQLEGANDKLVTFGATAHVTKAEPAYLLTTAKGSVNPNYYEESTCIRQDGSVPAPPLAYGPHCPDGVAGGYSYRVALPGYPYAFGGMGVFVGSALPGHEGDYGIGGSFGDSGGIKLTNALGVWLEPTPPIHP